MTTTETTAQSLPVDPLADAQPGGDDPIGAFDADNVCGKQISTGVNSWNTAECTREPHPAHWAHISTCDDVVEEVWFDKIPFEPGMVRLSHEGLVCAECAQVQTAILGENHYTGCSYDKAPHYLTRSAS